MKEKEQKLFPIDCYRVYRLKDRQIIVWRCVFSIHVKVLLYWSSYNGIGRCFLFLLTIYNNSNNNDNKNNKYDDDEDDDDRTIDIINK